MTFKEQFRGPAAVRSPWLDSKLKQNAARQRTKRKREARLILVEAGYSDVLYVLVDIERRLDA